MLKPMQFKRNKKGVLGMILFFALLLLILVIGFIAVIAVGILDIAADEIVPVMRDLGMAGETNLSEAAEYTFVPVNVVVKALPWLVGLSYVAALIFSIVFAMSYSPNLNPAWIGLYIVFIILLIFGGIIMSNAYQDIYSGSDVLALRLQENVLMSYMMLYSPFILALIAFITGIYLFTAKPGAEGGFGI